MHPGKFRWNSSSPGATLAEAWLLFEEMLKEQFSQYDYIQAMEYNPVMAVI